MIGDYINGVEYYNGALQRIAHTEGSVSRQNDGTYLHEYVLRDHLGNTRVTFTDANNDGSVTAADIKQINNYYPFGLNMEGNWQGGLNGQNKYQYNGKEWNDDFGLGLNDYGSRFHDPSLGRWTTLDPLADKYFKWSPYNFCIGNPINIIDPNGRDVQDIAGGVRFTGQDAVSAFKFITSSSKNVYITLFTNGAVQGQTKEIQGSWRVLAVNNLKQASSVLDALGLGKASIENMVIEGHGIWQPDVNGNEVDRGLLNGTDGRLGSGDINRFVNQWNPKYFDETFGGTLEAMLSSNYMKVADFKNVLSYISADGKLVMNACQLGKGETGEDFAKSIGKLAGDRFNIYMNIYDSSIFNVAKDGTGGFLIAPGGRNYSGNTSQGWLHLNPQGNITTGTVKDVIINLVGSPLQIKN